MIIDMVHILLNIMDSPERLKSWTSAETIGSHAHTWCIPVIETERRILFSFPKHLKEAV